MNKIKAFISDPKSLKLAVVLGAAGVLIIFAGNYISSDIGCASTSQEECVTGDYVSAAEESLENVVRSITGEKSPVVYITAESGSEAVFAVESRSDDDVREENFVIIKNSDGDQTGLLLQLNEPEIKGVVVVTEVGNDPIMRERILTAVRTAFDIPSVKVCVVAKYK